MGLLENLKLNVYFMAIIYMSFVLFITSISIDTKVFDNAKLAHLSLLWLVIGLFLWLVNDMLGLHGRRVDQLRTNGKELLIDKLPDMSLTYVVMVFQVLIFIFGVWKSIIIFSS